MRNRLGFLRCAAIGLSLCFLSGCVSTLSSPLVQQFQVKTDTGAQNFTIASATHSAPIGNNLTGMFLFDHTGKLIWASNSANNGLLQSGLPQTILNGAAQAGGVIESLYGIK